MKTPRIWILAVATLLPVGAARAQTEDSSAPGPDTPVASDAGVALPGDTAPEPAAPAESPPNPGAAEEPAPSASAEETPTEKPAAEEKPAEEKKPLPKWTSKAGDSVEAEFVEVNEAGQVVLRTEAGVLLQIPLDALNPNGQGRVRAELARRERERQLAVRKAVEERRIVIPDAYQNSNESLLGKYEAPLFDAFVYEPSGRMDLFVKEEGRYLSPPIRISFGVGYYETETKRHRQRRTLQVLGIPEFKDNVAHFRMNMEDDVYAEFRMAVRPDGVDLGYLLRDPKRIQYPSSPRISCAFPAIFWETPDTVPTIVFNPRYPDGIERATFMSSISGFELRCFPLDARRGKTERWPYNRSVNQIGYNVGGYEIGGGVFGPVTLRIPRPKRGGLLSGYIYPDNLPAQGFNISWAKEDHDKPADREGEQLQLFFTK